MLTDIIEGEFDIKEEEPWYDHQDLEHGTFPMSTVSTSRSSLKREEHDEYWELKCSVGSLQAQLSTERAQRENLMLWCMNPASWSPKRRCSESTRSGWLRRRLKSRSSACFCA